MTPMSNERRKQLEEIFQNIDKDQKSLVEPELDEVVFLETRMEELKKLPFVEVHPKNPARQRPTAAAREYKNCQTSYINALRFLYSILKQNDTTAQDALFEAIKEFM